MIWRFLHNCIAHPLLFLAMDAAWSVKFHDSTSKKMHDQYPKIYRKVGEIVSIPKPSDKDESIGWMFGYDFVADICQETELKGYGTGMEEAQAVLDVLYEKGHPIANT